MKYMKPVITIHDALHVVQGGMKNKSNIPDQAPDIRVHSLMAYEADE